jgi:hypothetical protein
MDLRQTAIRNSTVMNSEQTISTEVTIEQASAIIGDATALASTQYNDRPDLMDQLVHLYNRCLEQFDPTVKTAQQTLGDLVKTEKLIIGAYNDHRLGRSLPSWTRHACYKQKNESLIDTNLPDIEGTFPLRVAARQNDVVVADPGRIIWNATLGDALRLAITNAPSEVERRYLGQTYLQLQQDLEAERLRIARARDMEAAQSMPVPDKRTPAQEAPFTTPAASPRGTKRPAPNNTLSGSQLVAPRNKLYDAPSMNVPFPTGNMTAAEVAAFLPHWMKSWDVIERFAHNGGTKQILARMVNTLRTMPRGLLPANTILKFMQNAMRRRPGNDTWTMGGEPIPASHDPNSLSVTGYRVPRDTYPGRGPTETEPGNYQFKDLATGVKHFPVNDDALDLTRLIQYHVNNPSEIWNFPGDYTNLVRHIGGPAPVIPANTDRAVFARWKLLPDPTRNDDDGYDDGGNVGGQSKGRAKKRRRTQAPASRGGLLLNTPTDDNTSVLHESQVPHQPPFSETVNLSASGSAAVNHQFPTVPRTNGVPVELIDPTLLSLDAARMGRALVPLVAYPDSDDEVLPVDESWKPFSGAEEHPPGDAQSPVVESLKHLSIEEPKTYPEVEEPEAHPGVVEPEAYPEVDTLFFEEGMAAMTEEAWEQIATMSQEEWDQIVANPCTGTTLPEPFTGTTLPEPTNGPTSVEPTNTNEPNLTEPSNAINFGEEMVNLDAEWERLLNEELAKTTK